MSPRANDPHRDRPNPARPTWMPSPRLIWFAASLSLLAGCARQHSRETPAIPPPEPAPAPVDPHTPAPEPPTLREVFPGIRVDAQQRTIEFDGIVPIDAHDPVTPIVYLEMFACPPDTHEHEALVMANIGASHLHAALLLAGFQPGHPGHIDETPQGRVVIEPEGDALDVRLIWTDDAGPHECRADEWIIHEQTGERLSDHPRAGWVFAGSRIAIRGGREVYDADGTGHLISLATWGDDTIAWADAFSPWVAIDLPVWIADGARVPKFGTPVTVRVTSPHDLQRDPHGR